MSDRFSRSDREAQLSGLLTFLGHRLYHASPQTRGQALILQKLSETGRLPQRQLQEELAIQAGSLSELLGKMEGRGWILREKDQRDRRCVQLSLTPAGRAAARHFAESRDEPLNYDCLSDDELLQLTDLVQRIADRWREEHP